MSEKRPECFGSKRCMVEENLDKCMACGHHANCILAVETEKVQEVLRLASDVLNMLAFYICGEHDVDEAIAWLEHDADDLAELLKAWKGNIAKGQSSVKS